jgi:phosphatidylglycerol:prolipoprotein diacylglycerol transferase
VTFPVYVFGIHPHHVFDFLAFLVGGRLFWMGLRRENDTPLRGNAKWVVAGGCVIGAALGAKLIVLLEDPAVTVANAGHLAFWLGGKSIVGGLLGGWLGVEIAKREMGIVEATGDSFALPIAVGLAIGRVGCYLSGLTDDTYGTPTTLPWGVDFGDGVPRHPAQLYEAAFAVALAVALVALRSRREAKGDLFKLLMVSYFAFRFLEEFVRVTPRPWLGFTIYQIACVAGLAYALKDAATRSRLRRLVAPGRSPA